jgi:cytoskeletal protein CcmA (bactofilin family)
MFGWSDRKKNPLDSVEENLTFLARGFEFKGTLHFDGPVRLDGVVTGEIHTKSTLILGEHALVAGDVAAGTIVSSGTINGNVTATEKVHLAATAALLGSVRTPLLHVEEGVRFQGDCEATGDKAEPLHQKVEAVQQEATKALPQLNRPRLPLRGEI